MRKLLITWVCGASLLTGGCSSMKGVGEAIPNALDRMPVVYRPDIQQGNVVDQEEINRLQPGMSKSQVRYIMGTPMLVDVFHQNRWDYLYSMQEGGEERSQKRIALHFEDDRLVRIEGDLRPLPPSEDPLQAKEDAVVTVPDYTAREKGLIGRALDKVGLGSEED